MAGVIDQDYRGNVGVIIFNTEEKPIEIKAGDKIAQAVLHIIPYISSVDLVEDLDVTVRNEGGWGDSGFIGG